MDNGKKSGEGADPSFEGVVRALRAIRGGGAPAQVPVRLPRQDEPADSHQALDKLMRHVPLVPQQDVTELLWDGHPYDVMGRALAAHYGIELALLYSKRRAQPAATVRHIFMYLLRSVCGLPFAEIGRAFNTDHSTVIHGCKKITALRTTDQCLAAQLVGFETRFAPLRERVAAFAGISYKLGDLSRLDP